jgi:heme exporter protein C
MGLNARLSFMMAQAIAPTGAMFTFLALLTGAMWGKPTWGAWWVWDARLTSELILLFQYAGVMLLRTSIDDMRRADRSSAVFSLVGVVNVPIIYYSVQWWNTLHQGASVSMSTGSKMAATMLMAMLIMTVAFWLYSIAVILARVRCIVVERDSLPVWDEKPAVSQEVVEVR